MPVFLTVTLFNQAMQAALCLAQAEAAQATANADNAKARRMEKFKELKKMGLSNNQLDNFIP
ncbi:MAG TPA: hypothetical protein DEB17_02450 [Chlorobaculum sp.]|jgi:hypothetical protein|uniref:Uncharacterized protein n=1 Tax=Chlorobaculum tepidum (strain ATCC 49652 / DSM 12025 / NBRC 103806 / TLS) TaxID=194439 RepID=Q8KEI7_CHLTE|nr:hypothetical protein [Chlorobaculum tepidum]AAM71939.1 hypothetical protein CT0702 [Chlorobaculum tepidum TLS]HBU22858.1 hypothetical protein [Chlorobaculum sp.]